MRPLTQEEVNALPIGTEVEVIWSGGNGPHRYKIIYGVRVSNSHSDPLVFVGERPLTEVRLVNLIDKLRIFKPKKPEPPKSSIANFTPETIRRAAEAFAHGIDFSLPADKEELVALLWVFGEILDGEVERMHQSLMRQISKLTSLSTPPLTIEIPAKWPWENGPTNHTIITSVAPDDPDGSRDLEIADCPDCRKAAAHAYSDETTPGFFYTECEKHRAPGIQGAAGVVMTQEMTIEEAKRRFYGPTEKEKWDAYQKERQTGHAGVQQRNQGGSETYERVLGSVRDNSVSGGEDRGSDSSSHQDPEKVASLKKIPGVTVASKLLPPEPKKKRKK